MPTAIILAGPNGAGKTTFANTFLRDEHASFAFLNADEIARTLVGKSSAAARDLRAGRLLLERLDACVAAGENFIVETTLSTRLYGHRVLDWKAADYRVALAYIRLPAVADSLNRVRQRVARGGHDIAQADILRRFDRSRDLLETAYKPIVDAWIVVDSREGGFHLADWSGR